MGFRSAECRASFSYPGDWEVVRDTTERHDPCRISLRPRDWQRRLVASDGIDLHTIEIQIVARGVQSQITESAFRRRGRGWVVLGRQTLEDSAETVHGPGWTGVRRDGHPGLLSSARRVRGIVRSADGAGRDREPERVTLWRPAVREDLRPHSGDTPVSLSRRCRRRCGHNQPNVAPVIKAKMMPSTGFVSVNRVLLPHQIQWSALVAALLGAVWLSGCLDRSRLNSGCEWIGDPTNAPLALAIAADRRHLATDVRIAGENATRYRDSVQLHFGFAAAGSLDVECLDRLYGTIGTQHRVNRADIEAAAQRRDLLLDVALVYLPIGTVFLFVSFRLCRRFLSRTLPSGERWMVLVGLAWIGLGASATATAVAYLHSWNVETVRLRDFHMSFRASYLPLGRHPWLSFLVAFAIFGVAGWRAYRAARNRPADHSRGLFLGEWQH